MTGTDGDVTQGRGQLRSVAEPRNRKKTAQGLKIPRHFTRAGTDPYNSVEWESRSAKITNERGDTVFEQTDVEVPSAWSQLATNVVVRPSANAAYASSSVAWWAGFTTGV